MKDRRKRLENTFKGALPIESELGMEQAKAIHRNQMMNDPKWKKEIRRRQEQAYKTLECQLANGLEFVNEQELRYYLHEFNHRAWTSGIKSLPAMYNIMEAFFEYHREIIYFELLEEETYNISLFDFIDFITSDTIDTSEINLLESIESDLIYHFNVVSQVDELTFKTDNGKEFIVGNISMVRRGNEVIILLFSGEVYDEKEAKMILDSFSNRDNLKKPDTGLKNEINIDESRKIEIVNYLDRQDLWLTLAASRFDIESETINVRYLARDYGAGYSIVTDDLSGMTNHKGELLDENLEKSYIEFLDELNSSSSLFELSKFCMYLPFYLVTKDEEIIQREYNSNLGEVINGPMSKRKFKMIPKKYKQFSKPVYFVESQNTFFGYGTKIRDDRFKIETDGFWKTINVDEMGVDKVGNPIQGKTWVERNLTYYQAPISDLTISSAPRFSGPNSGYIYIMRQASMNKDIFKIGLTTRNTDQRSKELSKTSVPDDFLVVLDWEVKDCKEAEKKIHEKLKDFRLSKRREFFKIKLQEAAKVCEEIINEINKS